MELIIESLGQCRCIYGETLDLAMLGSLNIRRASHVEPDDQGRLIADLGRSMVRNWDHSSIEARRWKPRLLGCKQIG